MRASRLRPSPIEKAIILEENDEMNLFIFIITPHGMVDSLAEIAS
jgi:hypothetical protein